MAGVLLELLAGLQCGLLFSDGSPPANLLHGRLSGRLPLAYPAPPLGPACPLLLLHCSPARARLPPLAMARGPAYRVLLVTWEPPTSRDVQAISNYFHRMTFLWISEFGKREENYRSFDRNEKVLRIINETEATKIFKVQKLSKLPDYKGKRFTIAANNISVYSQLSKPDKHGNFRRLSGFELDGLLLLCKALGLRPEITKVLNFDLQDENGTLLRPGLQTEARKGFVDAAVGAIWYRPSMVGQVDMLPRWGQGCFRYLIPRPERVIFDWTLILNVFHIWVWFLIFFFVVFVAVLLFWSTKLIPNTTLHKEQVSLLNMLFVTSSVLMQVPLVRRDWRGPRAVIVYGWVWTTLILAAAFGGSLSSILVQPEFEEKPKTIQEFLERGYTHGSLRPIKALKIIFQDDLSDSWEEWKYGRFRIEESLQDRIDRMKTRKYVVSGESMDRIFFFMDEPIPPDEVTRLYEVADNCHQSFLTGPILPLGSPYSAALHKVASHLRSGGILSAYMYKRLMQDSILRKFVPSMVFTPTEDIKNNFHPLRFGSLSAIFGVLGAGHILASCCFLTELFLGRQKPSTIGEGFEQFAGTA